MDWETTRSAVAAVKPRWALTSGRVPQGFLFMRLTCLRGLENLMLDVATEAPGLQGLIDFLVEHNRRLIEQYVGMGADLTE